MIFCVVFLQALISAAIEIPFSVPLVDSGVTDEGIPLSIPTTIASNSSNVSIVKGEDCASSDFIPAIFISSFPGSIHNLPLSFFKTKNRPVWMTGNSPSPSTICVNQSPIGFVDYYISPILSLPSGHPPYPKTFVQVRTFMNPGWVQALPSVPCSGCDVVRNSFAFKEPKIDTVECTGHREEGNFLTKFSTTKGDAVNIFPFKIELEHAGGTVGDILHSWTWSSDHIDLGRGESESKFPIVGKPVHLCFYPDENADQGVYLGDSVFILSENDTSALVFFLLFIGIGLPSICMITTALYCYKFKQHRKWLRDMRHLIQTAQLEAEMQERNFMVIERE